MDAGLVAASLPLLMRHLLDEMPHSTKFLLDGPLSGQAIPLAAKKINRMDFALNLIIAILSTIVGAIIGRYCH
jgi:hypothetical protein